MKSKGFKWLLGVLAENTANIRILDTFIMYNFVATDCYYCDSLGIHHRKLNSDRSSKDILELITGEKSLTVAAKSVLAIGYYRGGRVYFTESILQEFYSNPHHNFTYIQKCGSQCIQSCQLFTASLMFKSNSYEFKLFSVQENGKKKVKNIIWIQRVKDILASINFIVQDKTGYKVKKAKHEFVKDPDDFFWVSFYSCEFFQDDKVVVDRKKQYYKVDTPEITDESSEEMSLELPTRQISMKKNNNDMLSDPFGSDFLELICRNRIKDRKSPDKNLPSLFFYAEPEEINAEKAKILKLMQDRNYISKGMKNDKVPRRTMWMEQNSRKSNFLSPLPRVSSPLVLSAERQSFLLNLTPSPYQPFLQIPGMVKRKSLKKVTLKRNSKLLT